MTTITSRLFHPFPPPPHTHYHSHLNPTERHVRQGPCCRPCGGPPRCALCTRRLHDAATYSPHSPHPSYPQTHHQQGASAHKVFTSNSFARSSSTVAAGKRVTFVTVTVTIWASQYRPAVRVRASPARRLRGRFFPLGAGHGNARHELYQLIDSLPPTIGQGRNGTIQGARGGRAGSTSASVLTPLPDPFIANGVSKAS